MTDPSWKPDFETLSAYLDGELPPEEMARIEAYVKSHPEIQKELDELRALDARVAAPAPGEPELELDAFTRKLWEEVDRHRERSRGFGSFPLRFVWVPLAAAVAIIVVMRSNLHRPEIVPHRTAVSMAARPASPSPKDSTESGAAGSLTQMQTGSTPVPDEAPAASPPVKARAPKLDREQKRRQAASQAGDRLQQKSLLKEEAPAPDRPLGEVRLAPPAAAGAPVSGAPAGAAKATPIPAAAVERPVDNLVQAGGLKAGVNSPGPVSSTGAVRADASARAPSAARSGPETLERFLRRVDSRLDKSKKEMRLGYLSGRTKKPGPMRPKQIDSTSGAQNEMAPTGAPEQAFHAPEADTLALLANAADALLAERRTSDAQQALGWMVSRYNAAPPTPRTAYRVELALRAVSDPLSTENWEPGDDLARWTASIESWRAFASRWKTAEGWTAAGVSLALQYRQSGDVALCRQARECFSRALDASPSPTVERRIGSLRKKYADCVVE